jgi:hypothetical protein
MEKWEADGLLPDLRTCGEDTWEDQVVREFYIGYHRLGHHVMEFYQTLPGEDCGGSCPVLSWPSSIPTPYTLHPTPYTLHPTPYTLHPTPYTLHPTPYTLNLSGDGQALMHLCPSGACVSLSCVSRKTRVLRVVHPCLACPTGAWSPARRVASFVVSAASLSQDARM